MPPAFWELVHDVDSVGCTVHFIDDQLDTGPVVAEAEVRRQPYSTLRGLQLQLDEFGVPLMRDLYNGYWADYWDMPRTLSAVLGERWNPTEPLDEYHDEVRLSLNIVIINVIPSSRTTLLLLFMG